MDQMARAGDLKGELVNFALSERFDGPLSELVLDAFPGGVVNDESALSAVIEDFLFNHRLESGSRVVERFVAERRDLDEADRALLLGWLDNVQGMFEITEPYRDDGVVAFNHVDELTYRVRSNMGAEGVEALTPGTVMIGGIVPVGDEWMISGTPTAFPADQADEVLAGLPGIVMRFPERVFRNPEKLAQARELQAEQRRAYIDLNGGDLIVVPGEKVHQTLMALYRHIYERAGSTDGPWTEPDLPPLPEAWTTAEDVALIYDEEDGLGFYVDYPVAQRAFADPDLIRRRPYREVISAYLRDEGISPVPIRRLVAEAGPAAADRVFRKLLKRSGFSWERDGEDLLRRYKADWYAEPPLPRVTPSSPALSQRFQDAKRS
ncbi:hypothetical protein [Actinomadura livida]|uniref:Uncharacterized protein n=1 Tax=Actinomadura livida TaxID=79909 RepID=A0A7W7ICB1_9ACTN|nr:MULTISPECIES: hypothetical protein [Actinomadura]MBB4774460.1 hypothetical protein [Actinomadura catellatispora]GGT82381.1 hypothetical protein GCM10010208_00840 [Actinomadura livida]